ncbi:MAG: hypothetical protein AABZ31_04855 [Bdellovibrionota bacterium]
MKFKASIIAIALTLSTSAFAMKKGEKFVHEVNGDIIKTVTIQKIADEPVTARKSGFMDYASDCSALRNSGVFTDGLPSTGDVRIDAIINIGAKVFTLIKDNAPLITTASVAANALPMGISCWNQLEGWRIPRGEVYRVTYKNLYGIKVVDFEARLAYSFGGNIDGTGRYLANATIQYKRLNVKVGYVFDANVEIPQVLNLGTRAMPVAGMQLNLNWSVTTRPIAFKKELNTATFFISGDGRPTKLY